MTHLLSRRAAASLLLSLAACALAAPALAEPPTEGQQLVDRAVAYLEGLANVKARFVQSDERGDQADGTLYLSRPGRARFQYDPPSTMLITSDGRTVIVSDKRLKSFQHFPLSSTPLGVFLAQHIRLDRGTEVERVDITNRGFSVTARQVHSNNGEITLFFEDSPMRLTGWTITDAQNRLTRVAIKSMTPIDQPPDDYFTQAPP